MAKPLAPPGRSPTDIIKDFVDENKDDLNAAADEFTDGDYGPGTQDSSDIDTNADKTEVKANEDKAVETEEELPKKVKVDPQEIAYTSDGRVLNLPLPNVLRQFASYNYRIAMYALTNAEINDPDNTYRIRRPSIAILQSGGGLGDSKTLTAYESSGKKVEFYCDSLEVEALISPSRRKGTTNAVGFRLEITEPYSMGLFLQALQVGAYQAGHQNYLEAPFLLTLDFVGWDNDGNPKVVPEASKLLPFKLVGSGLEVNNGGSQYVVEGVAYNEGALKDATQSIPCDVTLVGRTLEELFQSSPKSLSSALNQYYGKRAIEQQITTADQYFVVFPKTRATKGNLSGGASDGGAGATTASGGVNTVSVSTNTAQRKQQSVAEIQDYYKMIKDGDVPEDFNEYYIETLVSQSPLGQEITDKQTGKANANEIGLSTVFDLERLGSTNQPFGDAKFTWDKEKNVWSRSGGQMQLSPGLGEIKFTQGTRIQDIVEELVTISEYGRSIVGQPSDSKGFKKWFKIDTQVFNITDPVTEKKQGTPPKIYVFRIMPYLVNEAKFLSPDKIPYGIAALKQQVCKEYNYIYSGKNDDILNFNINLDNTFFKSISPGVLPKLNVEEGKDAEESPVTIVKQTDADNDQAISGKTQMDTNNNTAAAGAVDIDDMRVELARKFNDAIVNSDADLLTLEMEIWGDPYYLADSGVGNYNSENTEFINIDADGNIDYQYGEVDVVVNFRTPVDYKENGLMGFPEETIAVDAFSGLYQVIAVKNILSDGQFKQTIELVRRPNQYIKKETSQDPEKANQEIRLKDNFGVIESAQAISESTDGTPFQVNADSVITTVQQNRIKSQDAKEKTGVDEFGGNDLI